MIRVSFSSINRSQSQCPQCCQCPQWPLCPPAISSQCLPIPQCPYRLKWPQCRQFSQFPQCSLCHQCSPGPLCSLWPQCCQSSQYSQSPQHLEWSHSLSVQCLKRPQSPQYCKCTQCPLSGLRLVYVLRVLSLLRVVTSLHLPGTSLYPIRFVQCDPIQSIRSLRLNPIRLLVSDTSDPSRFDQSDSIRSLWSYLSNPIWLMRSVSINPIHLVLSIRSNLLNAIRFD